MASGTSITTPPPAPMKPTPAPTALPAEPTLLEGTDPVLLVRLYPSAINIDAASAAAIAQGRATQVEAEALVTATFMPPLPPAPEAKVQPHDKK